MSTTEQLILVDSDVRRRAAICHCLTGSGIHVEPYEDASEVLTRWPRHGILLVHDHGHAIPALIEYMGHSGEWLPIVAFAEEPGTRQIVKAVLQGAIDYIGWPFGEHEIAEVLNETERRAQSLGSAKLREATARGRIDKLSKREREVLAGVAGGLSNRMIGERLEISPRTVEIHRANMLNKLGANHTSDAIRIAIEAAMIR